MENLTNEELEIIDFYREGCSVSQLSEVYEHSVYLLKKLLANEPALQPLGYQWRRLFPLKVVNVPKA